MTIRELLEQTRISGDNPAIVIPAIAIVLREMCLSLGVDIDCEFLPNEAKE